MALTSLVRRTWVRLFGSRWGFDPDPPVHYIRDVVQHGPFASYDVERKEWVINLVCEAWRRGFEARGFWEERQFALQVGDLPPYQDVPGYDPSEDRDAW